MSWQDRIRQVDEADRRKLHASVVAALDWAAEQRESQTAGQLDNALAENENWQWRQSGVRAAEQHDRACVDDVLREMLGLPGWEEDGAVPPNERRGHLGRSGEAGTYADRLGH